MSGRNIYAELDPIFHPRSLALIGASGKQGKMGRVLMDRFLEMGFEKLYPVNPRESEILGVRAYRTVTDIPGPVDLAIIVTPTDAALAAVTDCAAKGVRAIVITTSGFAETGAKGKELQEEMVRIARERGARVIGPNCVGLYCPSSKLPFPLGAGNDAGSVGLVSQSGFFADFLTLTVTGNGIAFSKAISCGNESDLTAVDFLDYLGEDPETKTIVAYLEGMKEGRRFYTLAKEVSKRKPIILWKGGISAAGARAAASHTGALAGSRPVWEGVLRQAGIISVRSFEGVLDCLYVLHLQPLPAGPRVGIVSGPGGMAVGATDMCLELGLEVPEFSALTLARLRKAIPPVGSSVNNPVDLSFTSLVAPHVHRDAIRIVAEDEKVDMVLLISAVGGGQLCDIILEAMDGLAARKPLATTLMSGTVRSVAKDLPLFLKNAISVYTDPIRACKALARLSEYARFRAHWSGRAVLSGHKSKDSLE